MATTEFVADRPAGAGARLLRALLAVCSGVAAVWRAVGDRRAVRPLLHWDERMLRDIGLTPEDIHGGMALPMAEHPSWVLSGISARRRAAAPLDITGRVGPPRRRRRD